MKQPLLIAVLAGVLAMPTGLLAQAPLVKLEMVASGGEEERRVFFGRVVARETVEIAFQVGGEIVDFPLEEGAPIQKGDLVALLDQEPFELALAEAAAQNAQVVRTADRYRELVGKSVTETNLQDAETQAELAGIALRNAERALDHATLHAPFDGIVAARIVPNYSTVSAGTPVVRLHDMSDLRIEIDVPETLVQRVGRDTTVEIFAEFPSNNKSYPMTMREYNAETALVGQTYSITLGMVPPEDLDVLPGASAKVTAYISNGDVGILVPASAIIVENDNSTSVMVFSPNGANTGIVTATPVEIVPTSEGKVKILSGLEAGQEIVVVGASALSDGEAVRRFVGFED